MLKALSFPFSKPSNNLTHYAKNPERSNRNASLLLPNKFNSLTHRTFSTSIQINSNRNMSKGEDEYNEWRKGRLSRLTQPDGWLALVDLHFLSPGKQTVGQGEKNDHVVSDSPSMPERLGTFELNDNKVNYTPGEGVKARIKSPKEREQNVEGSTHLEDDSAKGGASIVAVGPNDDLTFLIVKREDQYGLRVRDAKSKQRTNFKDIKSFGGAFKPEWRVPATFVPYNPPKKISVVNALGKTIEKDAPGYVVFKTPNSEEEQRLDASTWESENELFIVMADATTGKQTYGGGRFLVPKVTGSPNEKGERSFELDLNRAFNPPCLFTDFATCPRPTKENRLKVAVEAGETTEGLDH